MHTFVKSTQPGAFSIFFQYCADMLQQLKMCMKMLRNNFGTFMEFSILLNIAYVQLWLVVFSMYSSNTV